VENPLVSDDPNKLRYNKDVFEVRTMDEARRIILTPDDISTDARWELETPYLTDSIAAFFGPDDTSFLLDYGCGVGRIPRELIRRFGCTVLGIDISQSMRQLAPGYVGDARFASCGWPMLDTLIGRGMQVDGALAIWSLQHSPRVADDIDRIRRVLKPGGKLFVCNLHHFAVPTNQGWTDLGLDIRTLLADAFEMVSVDGISEEHTTRSIAARAFLGCYRKSAA
jgi:SAM-dependent methyltransferase